jgi:tetratricopeptide (TPR) repeat protein
LQLASQSPQSKATVPTAASLEAARPVQELINQGKRLRNAGNSSEAIIKLSEAVQKARELNDPVGEARSLITLSTAQIAAFRYRSALESIEEGRKLADEIRDNRSSGAARGNAATLYWQLGDLSRANAEAEKAVSSFKKITHPNDREKGLLARALLAHASIRFRLEENGEGYSDSNEAIALAESIKDVPLQVLLWDNRGVALLRENKILEASDALQKALKLSNKNADDDLAFVEEHLAELEIKKGHPDFSLALKLIDEAIGDKNPAFSLTPRYYPLHIRAKILLGLGNKSVALSELSKAVIAANQWRVSALPGDITNSQTVAELQDVYGDYAHLAADIALEKNDNPLAVNALEVLAENRAASLREQLTRVYGSNLKLPDEYFFKLSQLQSAQAEVTLGKGGDEDKAQLARIRRELSDLENETGLNPENLPELGERIVRRNSLRDIQHTLGRDQVLISITLGKDRSYLWAVTGEKVNLTSLPGEEELTSKAQLFASAVREGRNSSSLGTALSRAFFGGLPPDVWNRSEWMVVADGSLLNGIPFSALPSLSSGKPLIMDRSLRFLPSELFLLDRQSSRSRGGTAGFGDPSRGFVGIADPIYNLADARLDRPRLADAKSISGGITLARLVGGEKEVRSAAKESRIAQPVFLTGAKATRESLESALNQSPGIIHFAVHVVSPPHQPEQAALALSIKNGIPELLTPEVVASFHTPGSLVVLSGCSSGQGKVLPGVGLVGLSRAWLLAGASAVVVSSWPTPDDSGKFFASFYSHFHEIHSGYTAQRAALALRRTEVDMLNGSGYQTSPSFWGAFAVISKE